jgi:hypothetical protein
MFNIMYLYRIQAAVHAQVRDGGHVLGKQVGLNQVHDRFLLFKGIRDEHIISLRWESLPFFNTKTTTRKMKTDSHTQRQSREQRIDSCIHGPSMRATTRLTSYLTEDEHTVLAHRRTIAQGIVGVFRLHSSPNAAVVQQLPKETKHNHCYKPLKARRQHTCCHSRPHPCTGFGMYPTLWYQPLTVTGTKQVMVLGKTTAHARQLPCFSGGKYTSSLRTEPTARARCFIIT